MGGTVKAAAVWDRVTVTSDGTENAVVFGGASVDTAGWVPVHNFSRLTVEIEAAAAANTVTVEARLHPDATAYDLVAATSQTGGANSLVADKVDIMGAHSIRVLENGTDTQQPTFNLIVK